MKFLLPFLLLLAAVTFAYQPAWHGGILWDDDDNLTPPALASAEGLGRIWTDVGARQQYYPLLHTVFWIEHALWGDDTTGYHFANIALHALSAALLGLILRRLAVPGAWLAAAIFALHPVHVESVAWITQQKNTLSGAVFLGALLLYLRFDETRRRAHWLAALGVFALALLCKTTTAPLPAVLLVLFWWRRGRLAWRGDVAPLLPFFVLGAGAGWFSAWVERELVGAEGRLFDLTLVERVLVAGRGVWFYLGKLFWPAELMFTYPRWEVSADVWWQWLYPLGVLALLVLAWGARHHCRAPLAGLLVFLGLLFPLLGFFDAFAFLYSFVADHWQYLASLGVIVLVAAGLARGWERLGARARPAGLALCGALLLSLGGLTWRQSRMYAEVETLYRTTLAANPASWMAHNNLGIVLAESGRFDEAFAHYHEALRLRPDYVEAYCNLGVALAKVGRVPEAIEQYEQALRRSPGSGEAHFNLGNVLVRLGRAPEAIGHYELALRTRPEHVELRNNLGIVLVAAGRLPEAIAQFEEALRLRPDFVKAHDNLGKALLKLGRTAEAVEHFQQALQLQPGDEEARKGLEAARAQPPAG